MKDFISGLRAGNAVVLDTETTGLDSNAEILQIGIVSLEGETLFSSFVRPAKARRWDDALDVHGITWSDVQGAPVIGELAGKLEKILAGRVVAIYNADFDTRLLRQSIKADRSESKYRWMQEQDWGCVMLAYAAYWGQRGRYGSYRWQSLVNACRQQGIKIEDAHDALGDARMTAALIRKIEKKLAG